MTIIIAAALSGGFLLLAGAQIAEGEIQSGYSSLEDCVEVEGSAPINRRCSGYAGWDVYIGASEHSAGVAFSDRARDEQLAQRAVSGGLYQSFLERIEWRVRRSGGDWSPFATIHRWTASTPLIDDETGDFTGEVETVAEVLVVAALREEGPIGACHIAYVDTTEVHDANSVARAVADRDADGFRCGVDAPVRIGPGEAAQLMTRAGAEY
jgi:hypothetical protein